MFILHILWVTVAIVINYFIIHVNSGVFTAVCKLEALAKSEGDKINALQKYVDNSRSARQPVSDKVDKYLNQMKSNYKKYIEPHFVENPINAFHLVRSVHMNWQTIHRLIQCFNCVQTKAADDFITTFQMIQNTSRLTVSEEDVQGAAIGIVRLWDTYNLNLTALWDGRILDTQTDPLTPSEILYIVRHCDKDHVKIHWLKELLKRYEEDSSLQENVQRVYVYVALAQAYLQAKLIDKTVATMEQCLSEDPSNKVAQQNLVFFTKKASEVPKNQKAVEVPVLPQAEFMRRYEILCRGDFKRPVDVTSSLCCIYRRTKVPYYFFKEEILNYDPRVSMFYDVISEKEQQHLKHQVYDRFARSGVLGDDVNIKVRDVRISETAWLGDSIDVVASRLSKRIQMITGLSTSQEGTLYDSEDMQALNYGIGGMYEPHYDSLECLLSEGGVCKADNGNTPYIGAGDRVATFLVYLNDVKAGGATVFSDMGVSVPVTKGAAAFWYNIRRNGTKDPLTRHAGCPVLLGSKWVANKWIREGGQVFRRRCGMSIDSIDGPLTSAYRPNV